MDKILIATPTMGTVDVRYARSLESLDRSGVETLTAFTENSLVYAARDELCRIAIEEKTDYLMFIDSDMVFPSGALQRLLADNVRMVSGLCFRRRPPYSPCIWKTVRLGIPSNDVEDYPDYPDDSVFPIGGCGMALCLVKTDVLKAVMEADGTCFQPMRGFGEDISFCLRAIKHGVQPWCDSRVKAGHVGTAIYGEESFRAWRARE